MDLTACGYFGTLSISGRLMHGWTTSSCARFGTLRPPENVAAEEAETQRLTKGSPKTGVRPPQKNDKFGPIKPGTKLSYLARRGSKEPEEEAAGGDVDGGGDQMTNASAEPANIVGR